MIGRVSNTFPVNTDLPDPLGEFGRGEQNRIRDTAPMQRHRQMGPEKVAGGRKRMVSTGTHQTPCDIK